MENTENAFAELERSVTEALKTYSNVHRGTGHHSMVSTELYEQAREQVLDYLNLNRNKYTVLFGSPRRMSKLSESLTPGCYKIISSEKTGLPLGVSAMAVQKHQLPDGAPSERGGGMARLIAPGWIIWEKAPDKFEAGTPAIINVIAFAKALCMIKKSDPDLFRSPSPGKWTTAEILYHDGLENFKGHELLDRLRETRIGRDVTVPSMEGWKHYVNLDNSASTTTFSPVWDVVRHTWRQPPDIHNEICAEVRKICAVTLHAPSPEYEIIFTSNATEAINLVAENLSKDHDHSAETVIVSSLLEHSSNDLPWRQVTRHPLIRLGIDPNGFIDAGQLTKILKEYNADGLHGNQRIKMVAVSGASNVLGTCNDLEVIGRIAHQYGARFLVDAAQLAAHRQVDISGCGIDFLAFSAHKVYAPFGCGVLVARKQLLNFSPDEMEQIRRSGEANPGGIVALGKMFSLMNRIGMDVIVSEEQSLHRYALQELSKIKGFRGYGITDPESEAFSRKAGVIVFDLKKIFSNKIARELAIRSGIGVRFGCHCAHILIKHLVGVGPFFERFQWAIASLFPSVNFPGLTRVSLGIGNNREDIDTLVRTLNHIGKKDIRGINPPVSTPEISRTEVVRLMKEYVKDAARRVYDENGGKS